MLGVDTVGKYVIVALLCTNIVTAVYLRIEHKQVISLSSEKEIVAEKQKAIEKNDGKITDEVSKNHDKNLVVLSNYYIERLRDAERRRGKVPGASGAVDGATQNPLPSGSAVEPETVAALPEPKALADVPDEALPLAAQCAETTLQLEDLQTWVRDVKESHE